MSSSRRNALKEFSVFWAGFSLCGGRALRAQDDPSLLRQSFHQPERLPPADEVINPFEIEEVARRSLPKPVYDHIAAGAGMETTLRRNREYFERLTFRPRVLVDVSKLDVSKELFGERMSAPILVGPTSRHQRVHSEGEAATVEGAEAAATTVVVSHRSSLPIEEIAKRTSKPLWFQVDAQADLSLTEKRVKKAIDSGCSVVCLTAGNAYQPVLRRDVHNQYRLADAAISDSDPIPTPEAGENGPWPPDPRSLVVRSNPRMSWEILEQVKQWAGVPVLLKGVLSAGEARLAVERGIDGIVVSNHGGRATDGLPSTIEQLPKIAEAVGGRIPILIDSGFRRGTDMLKALALGADGILLGRPVLWALAAYGAEGVQKLLEILQHELALAMGLAGRPNLAAVKRDLVTVHKW